MSVAETAYGVISPHFDDGVLSSGRLMAANPGALLVTVFSGGPNSVSPITPWDCLCKFDDGDDVTEARRTEDVRAAAVLGASREDLGLWDAQYRYPRYGFSGSLESLHAQGVDALRRLIEGEAHRLWLAPVGWPPPDHRMTSEIAIEVAKSTHDAWGLYSELPYRIGDGADTAGTHGAVFRRWQDNGFAREREPSVLEHETIKRPALAEYGSQLNALDAGLVDRSCSVNEKYWRLTRTHA